MKTTKLHTTKTSASKFAASLGISRQLLASHRRNPAAPPIGDTAAWTTFLAAHGRDASAPPDLRREIAQKRLAILHEQHIAAQRDNATAAGRMIDFDDARRQATEAAHEYFHQLDLLADEMPMVLQGCSAVEIHQRLNARREEIRTNLNSYFEAIAAKQ